ncbi:DNA-directed RNA polymerases I and III subunit RPAC1 [Hypsibius exemplaris]|uniref:DNA-directed RNA polymerases I and III subunit RPAC1 n=1 Tax=Hypsibius exemplaris TaxID=2072580 RepID=A0A1W0WCQ1_HYPEX|nr:DNA-directed RNA polymerases I and III subunit RPAC1 [Hypsibius exemplaris]
MEDCEEMISLVQSISVEIQQIEDQGMTMEFDVVGIMASVANAIRRALLVEVPSMAPETIMLQQNKSVMQDEVLGHRIGLIPFKADPRKFKFRALKAKTDHPDVALLFELKVTAPKQPLKSEKRFTNTKVYTKDFKWIPHHEHSPLMDESAIRPVSEEILVNILRPSQEMDLRIHVVKGIGKDHIKFCPVSLASYRMLPTIALRWPVEGEDAARLQACFSPGVITIDVNEEGVQSARVADPRKDSGSQNYLRESKRIVSALDIGTEKDHFVFSIESIGALNVVALVKEASIILKSRCEYHYLSIGCQQPEAK